MWGHIGHVSTTLEDFLSAFLSAFINGRFTVDDSRLEAKKLIQCVENAIA
jgi:hypothetical protein